MRKLALTLILSAMPWGAWAASGSQTMANEAGLTYNKTYTQNLTQYGNPQASVGKVSVQVVYASVTYSSATFTDGTASTASITVATNNLLARPATDQITVPGTAALLGATATGQFNILASTGLGAGATTQMTVLSTSGLTALVLTINGSQTVNLQQGSNWLVGASTAATATNIINAINVYSAQTGVVASSNSISNAVIYATATVFGAPSRLFTITSTSPTAISSGVFSGGTAAAVLTVNGNTLTNGVDWTADVNSSSNTALSIAQAIQAHLAGIVVSSVPTAGKIVYTTATLSGVIGNSYGLSSSVLTSISTSSTNMTGGAPPALLNAWIQFNNDQQYNGQLWSDGSGTSSMTAVSIANWLNTEGVIVATAAGSVVYATATTAGVAGNAFTLKVSTTNLTLGKATFANGQDNVNVTVNGQTFTANVDFSTGTTTVTAASLATRINATLAAGVTCQAISNVVYATSTATGASANYALASSSDAALTLSPTKTITGSASAGAMTGGTNAGWTVNGPTITVTNHGYTTGLQVLFSTPAAHGIAGLVNQTTYYVAVVDSNNFKLASSTQNAVNGTGITLTSSSTQTTADTFGLVPLPFIQGSGAGTWQVSNDNLNYTTFLKTAAGQTVTGDTFNAVNPSTSTAQDFGELNYGYLRYSATGPTQGGVKLSVILNGKD